MNCVKETNKALKEKIVNFDKHNDYKTQSKRIDSAQKSTAPLKDSTPSNKQSKSIN